ncbi:hypothetical protein H6775_02115 [Candidatus Nomurabacteria bacterium]|nr:hypothetical protein [Candidatus Nomurabacteria bacterium]
MNTALPLPDGEEIDPPVAEKESLYDRALLLVKEEGLGGENLEKALEEFDGSMSGEPLVRFLIRASWLIIGTLILIGAIIFTAIQIFT